jgi:hypothetical protein
MKVYSSINEFLANKPGVAPSKPGIKETPGTKPGYPSPIRRDRPSVKPQPKAETELKTEDDLVNRFVNELRSQDKKIKIAYKAIKNRYSK